MNMSSLARRLEEYEADVESLKLSRAPVTRKLIPQGSKSTPREPRPPMRRASGARTIQIRDQGLRPFRVS
jgi:hypothetical protein